MIRRLSTKHDMMVLREAWPDKEQYDKMIELHAENTGWWRDTIDGRLVAWVDPRQMELFELTHTY